MAKSGDTEKSGPYREAVTTRLTPHNYERYEEYVEEEEIGKSEGLRRLIRIGLDVQEGEVETVERGDVINIEAVRLASFVAAISFLVVGFLGTNGGLTTAIGGSFIVVMLLWSHWAILKEAFEYLKDT